MAALTAKGISAVAIELLARSLSLPRTVTMLPGTDFSGSNGDTITVRVPQPGAARKQANPGDALTADDVNEVPVDVTLSHLYHLKNLSDQEATYGLEDFASQVTRVQVAAVATKAEDELASVMNALSADGTIKFAKTASDDDTDSVILAAREALGKNNAPPSDRYLAVAPDIATRILSVDKFVKANESGSTDALRDAIIGRIYGFTVVESNALATGTAVAYHRSGFAFANRTPALPKGATQAFAVAAQGLALRQVFQYDAGHAQDQSLLSTMAGAAAVYEKADKSVKARWVKIGTSAT